MTRQELRSGPTGTSADSDTGGQYTDKLNAMTLELYNGVDSAQSTANTANINAQNAQTTADGKQNPIPAGTNGFLATHSGIAGTFGTPVDPASIEGTGGTSNHAALTNLAYTDSGHTGFSPEIHVHNIANITSLKTELDYINIELARLESDKEDIVNKVALSSTSTVTDYPNAKSVYDMIQYVASTIPAGGLSVPVEIDLESDLVDPITLFVGWFAFVQDMDITAPGLQGKVWVNYTIPYDSTTPLTYYRIVDRVGTINRTVTNDDNATAAITDTGGNITIPTGVTLSTISATSTQNTSTTRQALRTVLNVLRNNIAWILGTSGLGSKANTTDLTAHTGLTTTAHGGIEPTITAGTSAQYWRGDKTWQTFPAIPAAPNDAALTVTQNGITVGSNFTANTATARTYGIIAPDWNAASGTQGFINNKPTIPTGTITGVTAGDGITGGGTTSNVTVTLGTPSAVTSTSTNSVTTSSHAHQLADGAVATAKIVNEAVTIAKLAPATIPVNTTLSAGTWRNMPLHGLDATIDLNDIRNTGFYQGQETSTVTNGPSGVSLTGTSGRFTMLVLAQTNARLSQTIFHNTSRIYHRAHQGSVNEWTTWKDITDTTGGGTALNRTVTNDDNATAAITDTGGNITIPTGVTLSTVSATSTQNTSTARQALRTVLNVLRNNIAWILGTNGLGSKANTTDLTAHTGLTTTAHGGIEPTITAGTTAQYWRGDKTWQAFPTIPAAQVNSDWNATTGVAQILNKPVIGVGIFYGISTTAAATAAKVLNITGFVRSTGAMIAFKLNTTNTAALPTLNVNGTGSTAIFCRGERLLSQGLANDKTFFVVYDGTNYEILNPSDITYGTVSTAVGTVAKTANVSGFVAYQGARVLIKFTAGNTATNPTLNINTIGARQMMRDGVRISGNDGVLRAGRWHEFIVVGTDYELINISGFGM